MDQMATRILILDDHRSQFHFEISCESMLVGKKGISRFFTIPVSVYVTCISISLIDILISILICIDTEY